MATLITPTGNIEAITPTNGVSFSASEIHELVDGYLECLRLRDGRILWFDDEGKVKGKPVNLLATLLALAVLQRGDVIVGNAVITTLAEEANRPDERAKLLSQPLPARKSKNPPDMGLGDFCSLKGTFLMSRTSISRCASCPARSHSSQKTPAAHLQPSLFEHTTLYEARPTPQIQKLREATAPYLCLDNLRQLATRGEDIRSILRSGEAVPEEVQALISLLSALLAPVTGEATRSPADLAALLMTAMGSLDHEEFWVICLDTGNHVQSITPLYRGTLNSAPVRAAEVFRQAISLGSAAIIVAHNHRR